MITPTPSAQIGAAAPLARLSGTTDRSLAIEPSNPGCPTTVVGVCGHVQPTMAPRCLRRPRKLAPQARSPSMVNDASPSSILATRHLEEDVEELSAEFVLETEKLVTACARNSRGDFRGSFAPVHTPQSDVRRW